MGKGSNTTTTSSTTAANPIAAQTYIDLLSRAQGVASTPYQSYSGELVAPVNAQQTAGINNINANAGFASPYIQNAAGLVQGAATPLTAGQIQQYASPYTQSVVDATQAQFNAQNARQQAQLKGNAISQGALGGNRVGVAQGTLAGQQQLAQAPVIAGLYNTGYQQALQTAQQQFQQNPLQAAYSLGNLGVAGQNAALQGAQAQVGAGTLQQQTQQAQDTAAYQQFLQQQGYPYQQTQWLAGLAGGLGPLLGSSTNGSQTTPAPNPLTQILGLGIAGLGAAGGLGWKPFAAEGGAIRKGYDGGGVVMPYSGAPSWVPSIAISPHALPSSHAGVAGVANANGAPDANKIVGQAFDLAKQFQNSGGGPMGSPGVADPIMSNTGWLDASGNSIMVPTYMARGGVAGYAGGGGPSFNDRFDAAFPAMAATTFDDRFPTDPMGVGAGPTADALIADAYKRGAVPGVVPDPGLQQVSADDMARSGSGVVPLPQGRPSTAPEMTASNDDEDLPPAITRPADAGAGVAPPAMAFNRDDARAGFSVPPEGSYGTTRLSPFLPNALLAAGLGMLASRSPFLGVGVGEGGLAGLNYVTAAQAAQAKQAQEDRRIDMEAQRLAQQAQDAAKRLQLTEASQKETARHNRFLEDKTPAGYEKTDEGYRPIKGGPADPDQVERLAKAKSSAVPLDDDTAQLLADRVRAGDTRALVGLARTPGAVARVQAIVARDAREGKPVDPAAYSILSNAATQAGLLSAERTQAQIMAKLSVYGRSAYNAIDLAEKAADEVPRSQFQPVNKIINAYKTNTGDPKIVALGQALTTLSNEYARAIGGGHGTVHDKEVAESRLSAAQSPEQLRAVMNIMRQEIVLAEHALPAARQQIRDIYNANPGKEQTTIERQSVAPPPAPAPAERKVGQTYMTPKGPAVWKGDGWQVGAP